MTTEFNPFASEELTAPFSEEWEARRRVADAIKQLTDVLVTSTPSAEQMAHIAGQLETTAEEFSRAPRIHGKLNWISSGEHGSFGQINQELSPLTGLSNPLSPPVKIWVDGDTVRGSCSCGWAYEGPPGSVHGGYVAAIFDQFLGMGQTISGQAGMTGYLHVSYHRRTPLNKDLVLEGRMLKHDGRKVLMAAEITADGAVTARCEALFVEPRDGMHTLQSAARQRAEKQVDGM